MSWKVEVIADNSGQWTANALRFGSQAEAETYAKDLFARWTLVQDWRVVQTDEPVNYAINNDRLVERAPLPRATEDMSIEPITDVDQFIREVMGDLGLEKKQ